MDPILPFRLKLPGKDEIDGLQVTSTSFRIHGFLHVDGEYLVIEWGGTVNVQEAGATGVRDETENLPEERLAVPVTDLYRVELTGGWFRPRLTVQARTLGALAAVPSEEFGTVSFWYDRSERFTAIAVAKALTEAIAAAGSRPIESGDGDYVDDDPLSTPPGGSGSTA